MDMSETLFVAFFCMATVFALLGGLYALVRLFSGLIKRIETNSANNE